jgi:hypothetical protein
MTASVPSLANLDEDGPLMMNISKFTTMKILDKQSNVSGVEYECELEPLWLVADLVQKARMGRGLRAGKRKFSQM